MCNSKTEAGLRAGSRPLSSSADCHDYSDGAECHRGGLWRGGEGVNLALEEVRVGITRELADIPDRKLNSARPGE
jgi:hypothetical protein